MAIVRARHPQSIIHSNIIRLSLNDLGSWTFGARSTVEGVVEEGGEEVLGLTQRLPLRCTQALHLLHRGREFLLEGKASSWPRFRRANSGGRTKS
jgi:hypothetical protein